MTILVTGSTGKVGSALLKELGKHNVTVRALVRKPDAKLPDGVEAVVGDMLDPVSVEKALDGVDKLYLLNGVTPDELTQGLITFGLAKKRKLKHIVYHSVFKAEHFKDVPHFASKVVIESALREFDVPFTIIRPNYFFQNDLSLKSPLMEAGVYPMPLGKVTYPGDDLRAFEKQVGAMLPSAMAYDVARMFGGFHRDGMVATPGAVDRVTKLLGRPLRTYRSYAEETARSSKP
jgi:uncharacterized protein YbjT (DUF2867 family)